MITPKLIEWLRREFYKSNHPKYVHYFEEWITNITPSQAMGFEKQMFNQENGILCR